MRAPQLMYLTGLVSIFLLPLAMKSASQNVSGTGFNQLKVSTETPKQEYVLGEMVTLSIKVTNNSNQTVVLPKNTGVTYGNVKVYVAIGSEPFKEYLGPHWGVVDSHAAPTPLKPKDTLTTEATLLFNHAPKTSHLSPLYAQREKQGKIDSDYAFIKAGRYKIKTVLLKAGTTEVVESSPLVLDVTEPQDNEFTLWKLMKSDAEYGYFIQSGTLREPPQTLHSQHIINTLNQVVNTAPNSVHSKVIQNSLKKYLEAQKRHEEGQEN